MKLFLLVFALQVIAVTSSKNDPIWKLNHERKAKLIAENQQQEPANVAPAGPYCQSLVAYFVGTFQSKSATTPNFTAEFQLSLDANLKKKRIVIDVEQWTEEFANSGDFELDFYYSNGYQSCDINQKDCTASLPKNISTFTLDLNRQDGTYFHLLHFDYFNNSFPISRPNGKCTKHQLDGINDDRTPNLDTLTACVCCDEYSPNKLLGCPLDPWNSCAASTPAVPTTTPAPIVPTTTTVKPTPPPPSNITCSSIIAYYNGVFKNSYNKSDAMPIEFQTRMWADDENYYVDIDHWNEDKTKTSDIKFYLIRDSYGWIQCYPPTNNNCSAPHSSKDHIFLEIQHFINENWMNTYLFSYFPAFNKQFTLYNAVGKCTKFQPKNDRYPNYAVDPKYFDFCMCCGDTYSPDASLGCPVNSWA